MKKTIITLLLITALFVVILPSSAYELFTKSVAYENDNYTFIFNNDLKTLEYNLKGFYVYMPNTLVAANVSRYWAAAGPTGAVLVYKIEPNTFPYALISNKTGKVEKKGYLYVDKYDVKDLKLVPTKDGAKATVYYVEGGDKSFDLKFNDQLFNL